MSNKVIEVTNLTKQFKSYKKKPGIKGSIQSFFNREYTTKKAVHDFNLEINKGEIIGLLGPNGAGKTTLMKMFTGIIVPSAGELTINGHRPWERKKDFKKKIALVMGQKSQLWWDIPAMDSFLLLQKFYELSDQEFKTRLDYMAELLGVVDLLHVHVRKLSLGERMKMELMASLLHNPDVIFLDEPTIGLDLVAQENIREFVLDFHKKNGTTIIITSHYMADVQALCKRLVLIFDGTKAYDGPLEKFEKILGNEKTVSFSFSEEIGGCDFIDKYDAKWNECRNHVDIRVPEEELREVSKKILDLYPVIEFNTEKMPIERVMKTLMTNPEVLRQQRENLSS
ncbi:MAG: multidrug ABC transporter ATP-binding protein [Halobacteriovorax sp.]|nr:multidrug ABC transporter ATP-binding protein [Halobacteriovorax sp.]|tara:strand:+ start:166416 stop:167435 length:1020 start_codon:yes stop_codon:yes gene_type:complete